MKRIIVTTDFSGNSKAGIRFAIQLALQAKCEIFFYHAIEIMKPTSWNDKRFTSFAKRKMEEFENKLIRFVHSVCIQSGIRPGNYRYAIGVGTDVPGMTIRFAKKNKASFICMSTHGAGKLEKLFGTNASALVTTSPVPVIVVPKGYRNKPIKNIFYASDFAVLGKEMKTVREFAALTKAKVEVFNYDYLIHVPEHLAKLEQMASKYESKTVSFNFCRQEVEHTLAYHLKADVAKRKPSLVILFTKQNRNWFDRLFTGGETEEMAFHSKVPLLAFRKKSS